MHESFILTSSGCYIFHPYLSMHVGRLVIITWYAACAKFVAHWGFNNMDQFRIYVWGLPCRWREWIGRHMARIVCRNKPFGSFACDVGDTQGCHAHWDSIGQYRSPIRHAANQSKLYAFIYLPRWLLMASYNTSFVHFEKNSLISICSLKQEFYR